MLQDRINVFSPISLIIMDHKIIVKLFVTLEVEETLNGAGIIYLNTERATKHYALDSL